MTLQTDFFHVDVGVVGGRRIFTVEISRREPAGQPIRREPEPILDYITAKYYESHTMGNDVYTYDWVVSGNGNVNANVEEYPLEHKYGDGSLTLLRKVLEAAGF